VGSRRPTPLHFTAIRATTSAFLRCHKPFVAFRPEAPLVHGRITFDAVQCDSPAHGPHVFSLDAN